MVRERKHHLSCSLVAAQLVDFNFRILPVSAGHGFSATKSRMFLASTRFQLVTNPRLKDSFAVVVKSTERRHGFHVTIWSAHG